MFGFLVFALPTASGWQNCLCIRNNRGSYWTYTGIRKHCGVGGPQMSIAKNLLRDLFDWQTFDRVQIIHKDICSMTKCPWYLVLSKMSMPRIHPWNQISYNVYLYFRSTGLIHWNTIIALTCVAQLVGCHSAKWNVDCSIPSGGSCLGCRSGPQLGAWERQPHTDISLPLFLPPFPSKNKVFKNTIIFYWSNNCTVAALTITTLLALAV